MKKTIQVEVNFRSFVETLIAEFTGIPGIEFIVDSPTRFRLNVATKSDSILNTIVVQLRSDDVWTFSFSPYGHGQIWDMYDPVYQISQNDIQGEYSQYTLLKNYLKAAYRYISDSIKGLGANAKEGTPTISSKKFTVPPAYLNLGVKLGILLCGIRTLNTECHFIEEDRDIAVFNNSLIANEMVANYDNITTEVEELRTINLSQSEYIKELSEEIAELNKQLLSKIIVEDNSEQLPVEVTEASAEVLSLVSNTSLGEPINDGRKAIQVVNDTIAGFDFPVT